jgi:hypothetical protein
MLDLAAVRVTCPMGLLALADGLDGFDLRRAGTQA